jgi:hypothetical protein
VSIADMRAIMALAAGMLDSHFAAQPQPPSP